MTEVLMSVGGDRDHSKPRQWWVISWIAVFTFFAFMLAIRSYADFITSYPASWTLPVSDLINNFMSWFVPAFKSLFRLVNWVLTWPMNGLQAFLQWVPWPITILLIGLVTYFGNGWRLAAFAVSVFLYVLAIGYWDESMNTLSLVLLSVPLAVAIGLMVGIIASKSRSAKAVIRPTLDVMQTFPPFAYLIPILFLFGFGPVVGLIASVIFAVPPMVRNVMSGLERVPPDVLDAGKTCGTTRMQLLWFVELPAAIPSIMIGVNQATMAALSMVIIASIIGGTADIGWEVLSTMRKAQFGQSLTAGMVIVAIAIIMDRTTDGFANIRSTKPKGIAQARSYVLLSIAVCILLTLMTVYIPALREFPDAPSLNPAIFLNAGIEYIIEEFQYALDRFKDTVSFYFLLPLRIGMENSVRPSTWGIALTPAVIVAFWGGILAIFYLVQKHWGWAAAFIALALGGTYYFGVMGLPWPAFMAMVCLLAFQVGGKRLAVRALGVMVFILVSGVWKEAMMSIYLCGAATLIAFTLGTSLGILAALNDRFSAFIRPVGDTLQTIPLFVFLIPVIMFFQVGDFSALLAIIMYAIVPSIRYTEFGIRNASADAVEAGRAQGCTRRQILWNIQIPIALPDIMMGLNQTVMFSLSMLAISALVGTKDLGQLVYVALAAGDVGKGLIAGASMSVIAIITDRIIQAWVKKKREQLA